MPDYTAIELPETTIPAPLATTFLARARAFFTGALFTLALAAVGAVLATVALTAAVVGSPLVFVAVAYFMVRRRRLARANAWANLRVA